MPDMINMLDVKIYFEYKTSQEFAADWKRLSDMEKAEIKRLVAIEIGKDY